MPGPDPFALWLEEYDDGSFSIYWEEWPEGNRRNRRARVRRLTRNIRHGGWRCRECGEPVPLHKRADAVYCRDVCRKAAARRNAREGR